ncbi:MAG: hypothetical protein CFH33_01080 [Alphaproteobacteria bacterium MarineAlpha9_Bin3]|nr:MAG: hypothetical protein CFH33_01080 [Alphaproteobacteria bacterium MarineAlpha9_Bin3]|tara:strand:+ start:3727 stop:4233 length:507 start_codon:yes stop_codon:yes gene_type:complete
MLSNVSSVFANNIEIPEDAEKISLVAIYSNKPEVNEISIGETIIATANFSAFISSEGYLNKGILECKVTAYAAPGRGFSCGFAQMENVSGYCIIKDKDEDSLVAKLECSSGATVSTDVRCEGRLDFMSGTGKYSGINGTARLHMEQIFTAGESSIEFLGWWRLPAKNL